jgi:ABC-type nickel/cobalt efflux system permease component RcnA
LLVLLSSIALQRVAYGLVLVVAFSLGLAATLTAIGILFVYAGHLLSRTRRIPGGLTAALPVFSALIITVAGALICYEALVSAGVNLPHLVHL